MQWISVVWTVVFGPCWLTHCYDLTAEDQDDIVERHNYFRSLVQPSATNMRKMSWDDSLARVAAGYAPKCVWEHNPDLEDLGENLYATNGPFNVSKAVTGWYLEYLDYSYHNNTCEEDKLCGHYTQVVWAETVLVGCSAYLCEEVQGLTFNDVKLLVCNYSPTGNYIDEWPYEEGEPCSNCPKDLQHCEMNICVAEPPSVTEEATERPQPGTDSSSPTDPSTTESLTTETVTTPTTETDKTPTTETDKTPTTETDKTPTTETNKTPTTETGESITPSGTGQPLNDSSTQSLPPIITKYDGEKKGKRGEKREEQWELNVNGGMPLCSTALLIVTLLLLTLSAST